MMGLNRFRPQCVAWWCSSTVWPLCTTQSLLGGLVPMFFFWWWWWLIIIIIIIVRCSQVIRFLKEFHSTPRPCYALSALLSRRLLNFAFVLKDFSACFFSPFRPVTSSGLWGFNLTQDMSSPKTKAFHREHVPKSKHRSFGIFFLKENIYYYLLLV